MPRQKVYQAQLTVRLTSAERARIEARAAAAGLSIARLLVESALADGVATDPVARARLEAQLYVARRDLRGVAEQLRAIRQALAGTGQAVPPELATTLANLAALLRQLGEGVA